LINYTITKRELVVNCINKVLKRWHLVVGQIPLKTN
jgi:hypothetical protein